MVWQGRVGNHSPYADTLMGNRRCTDSRLNQKRLTLDLARWVRAGEFEDIKDQEIIEIYQF